MTTLTETPAATTTRRTTPGSVPRSRPTGFVADTGNVMVRELRPVLRNPVSIFFAMVQPLVFLGLFAPLLPDQGEWGTGSALQWFVPGIVAMTALVGATITGSALTDEIMTGSHERLLVSPLRRSSLLVGRALKEVVPMLLQTAVILVAVTPFSFDLHLGGVLVGPVILSLFSVGVGSLSFALALVAKDQPWLFWTVQQTLLFPLLLLGGVLLPLEGAPGWLTGIAAANPLKYVVSAERDLFAGSFPADTVLPGLLAAALVAAVGLAVGLRSMRRAS